MSESKKRKQAANGNPEPLAAPAESARSDSGIGQRSVTGPEAVFSFIDGAFPDG